LKEFEDFATFGAGRFWGTEKYFAQEFGPALIDCKVGFMSTRPDAPPNPDYEDLDEGSGYVEVLHLRYDTRQCSYEDLVRHFFEIHDPTTPDQQGADRGERYKSTIFYHSSVQKETAFAVCDEVQEAISQSKISAFKGFAVTTAIEEKGPFYPAGQ
jgi:peptide-methionine (S)-S-oxide reductase